MLLFLAAVRDRTWRGCFSDGRPTSHEFNKLPLHLSAVLPCSLGDQLSERFPVKEQNIFFLSIKQILKGGKNSTSHLRPEVVSVCLSVCQLWSDVLGFLLGWHRQKAAEGGIWIKNSWFFPACVTPADASSHCCWECILLWFFKILSNEEAHQSSQHCVSEEGMLGAEHFSGMG